MLYYIIMNTQRKITLYGLLCTLLVITSCEWDWGTGSKYHTTFDYDLRGTWVSQDKTVYDGKLVIDLGKITITGFSENQTPSGQSDNRRPFKGYTKNVALNGFSEDGKLFIEDRGLLQEGIPYTYYTTGSYPEEKFLLFNFGMREERMQKQH